MNMTYKLFLFLLLMPSFHSFAIEGAISFEKFYRVNIPEKTSNSQDWLELSLSNTQETSEFGYAYDADLRLFINDDYDRNYSLAEAWMIKKYENAKLTFGRQKLDWHANEEFWQLGNLNGVQGFGLLDTKQEGLLGVQLETKLTKNWNVNLFISYLYVPSLNPVLDVEDGKIISTSEWVRLPPTETRISGRTVPIHYELNFPKISDVVFKKSLGIQSGYNWGSGSISGFAIYKPENKLRINAEASYVPAIDKVSVVADPVVNHHLMLGTQIEQNISDIKFIVGMDVTDPNAKLGKDFDILEPIKLEENNRTFSSEYFSVQPNYDRESYFHSSANWTGEAIGLSLNYIKLLSSNVRGSDDFFSDTVKWKSAVGLGYSYIINDFFNISGVFRYDLRRKDNILKNEVAVNLDSSIHVIVGLEFLKAPQMESYWSAYRANDTVYSSLNYTF